MGREPMPASPMMMAEGGEVFEIDDPATMEEASMAQEALMADPNADLKGAIEQLMMAERTAEDPSEAKKAQQLAESAMIGSEAPLGPMALELSHLFIRFFIHGQVYQENFDHYGVLILQGLIIVANYVELMLL